MNARLRPFEERDRSDLLEWRNDPSVARWMYGDHPISGDEHDRWFDGARQDTGDRRNRILDVDGVSAAVVSLTAIDDVRRSCTWGGYVVPGRQGRGEGTAALSLSLDLAFDELGLNRVWIEVFTDNERAISLYERLGFRREAVLRELVWKGGQPRDVLGLALLRAEWASTSSGAEPVRPGGRR